MEGLGYLAAAFTQIHKYNEAIEDCNKSIEIDPNYSKAYSRLGLAYYAQGNYSDAISKGFMKALSLDPNNDSIRENILVAEQKLEELQRRGRDQNAGQSHSQEPLNSESAGTRNRGPSFTSMPFNGTLPADFANILMNMAATAYNDQHAHDRPPEGDDTEGLNEPEIRIGGNISVSFGEGEVPEQLTGAWRSVMDMFSSAHDPQGDSANGGSAPN